MILIYSTLHPPPCESKANDTRKAPSTRQVSNNYASGFRMTKSRRIMVWGTLTWSDTTSCLRWQARKQREEVWQSKMGGTEGKTRRESCVAQSCWWLCQSYESETAGSRKKAKIDRCEEDLMWERDGRVELSQNCIRSKSDPLLCRKLTSFHLRWWTTLRWQIDKRRSCDVGDVTF